MSSNISQVVNRQILKWDHQRRAWQREQRDWLGKRPMITVSRACGARGARIAERVAKRLEFDLYDRQLVDQVASSARVRRRFVEVLDEHTQDWISEYLTHQFENESITASKLMREMGKVLLTIAQYGNAVVVGRGASFFLPQATTLRVRIDGPLELRVREVSQERLLSEREARALVQRTDAERREFCQLHFQRDVAAPEHYDLVLNGCSFGVEEAATIIASALRVRFP